ncbi:MAG: choice-of-anchor D domain-containing protein [Bryobacteraceae bacterium]
MKFLLYFALLLSTPAFAQLQLFTYNGTTETPVPAVFHAASTAVGDTSQTRFRVRNTSAAGITLSKIAIAGAGFTISSVPSLPTNIAPNNFVEFYLQFAPTTTGSYSASLAVNTINVIVIGAAVAPPTIALLQNGSPNPLGSGATIDFGRAQRGTPITLGFTITNTGAASATVNSIAITGAAFTGPIGLTLPASLNAGASAALQIKFQPPAPTQQSGTLVIDQRVFHLTGSGFDPPLPNASIVFDSGAYASAQQRTVSIPLDSQSQVSANGTLTLAFKPSAPSATGDAAVVFLTTGPNATVGVSPGDSVAKLNGQPSVTFQTGTTAGDLIFTLTLGSQTVQKVLTVSPAPIVVDSINGVSRVGDLDITITGYDNTYTASVMAFTFYDRSNRALGPAAITVDSTAGFRGYFATTKAGGSFALRATFPVAGDSTQVGAADVTLTNSAGASQTQHIKFP